MMRRKRKKQVLISIGLIALATVCFFALRPRNEPKYQDRYLFDWLRAYSLSNPELLSNETRDKAEVAVRNIGTNALPYLVKWIAYKRPAWRTTLRKKLPAFITTREPVAGWLDGDVVLRRECASVGFLILGTNAVSAIPELLAMIKDSTNSASRNGARHALISIGSPAIPALKSALADPNQPEREFIILSFSSMALMHGTNACLPVLIEALNDHDMKVRSAATNVIWDITGQFLTNTPAN